MEYAVHTAPDARTLRAATRLHIEALSDRSFITSFGQDFLVELYAGLFARQLGFLVTATDGERLVGFILACTDSRRLMSVVTAAPLAFARLIVPTVVRRPGLLRKLAETALYGGRERNPVATELLVIVVDPSHRSQGIGRRLLDGLRSELRDRGIEGYKVTVHEAMAEANGFYAQNGLRLGGGFRLYGVRWNLYVDRLP